MKLFFWRNTIFIWKVGGGGFHVPAKGWVIFFSQNAVLPVHEMIGLNYCMHLRGLES